MSKRAKRRRRGKRKEALKAEKKLMWQRLCGSEPAPKEDEIILGYQGNVAWQTASYYAPYMPIIQNSGIIGDCTA